MSNYGMPRPARAVPPGAILKRELKARGWTQRDLAMMLDRPPQLISEIVRGKKRITERTALELAEVFGTSPELWLNLESRYRLHQARREANTDEIARRKRLFTLLPVREMIKRGWVERQTHFADLEESVLRFLGLSSLEDLAMPGIAMRHANSRTPNAGALLAWTARVRQLTQSRHLPPFDQQRLLRALPELLRYSNELESLSEIPAFLNRLGIRFAIVPSLPKTYLDGAALLQEEEPVIALTLRYDRVDSFWFTLLHEIAHIAAGHRGRYLDDLDAQARSDEEKTADRMAQAWLIPDEAYRAFLNAHSGEHFSEAEIRDFAADIGRHPGIVVGRLQHDGLLPYSHLRRWLQRVSPQLTAWIDRTPRP